MANVLLGVIREEGIARFPWGESAARLRQRFGFLHRLDSSWPDLSDAALQDSLTSWLRPHLLGLRRMQDLAGLDLEAILLHGLDWKRRADLDRLAPTHFTAPSGSRLPIDYSDPAGPVLAVKVQEMFGLAETPQVGGGMVPLTLHLLSPARRPVQVTRDLAGFWRNSYFDVRKDLKGRYPKHDWPDPLGAKPARGAKRRG
jgi:ATP-dependent helicase HrpB